MLRSATLLPSGARSGPSRENQNDSVRSVASAGTATGWTITNCDAGWGPQLPSERPPIRAANRPVRTIAAVVPPSWRSTRLTPPQPARSEEHTSELQSLRHLVCRLLLDKKKKKRRIRVHTHTDTHNRH